MINYMRNVKPTTSKYAHGGHVHNLVEKAYQGHSFGGHVYDFSNAVVKKINDHLSSIPNQQRLENISNQIRKIPEYIHSGTQHIAQIAPKFEHGAKLAHELLKRYSGNN